MVVRELLTRLGLKVDSASFAKGDAAVEKTAGGMKRLGAIAGAVLAGLGVGLARFISQQVDAIDKIGKTSTRLGIQTEALQELAFAADLGGVSFDELAKGIQTLQKNAKEAADGSTEFAEEFKNLGINVKDSNGVLKDGPILFEELAESLSKVEPASAKVGIAQIIMGRAGAKLIPVMNEGAEGIRKLRQEAQELGFVLGEDDVRATEFLKDEMTRFERVTRGLKQQIFLGLLPTVTDLVSKIVVAGKQFSAFVRNSKLVEAALLVLKVLAIAAGVAFVIAFAGPILVIAKVAAGVAALLLVVDDLLTLFDGGRSVIGLFIDEIFGLGAADEFVANHRAGVEWMAQAWDEAGGSVVGFFGKLLGFEADVQAFAEGFESLGASVFEFLDRARVGLQNLLDTGFTNIVALVARITGQGDVADQIVKMRQKRVQQREFEATRTTRGMGGQETGMGLLGGNVERGRGIQQRLQERRQLRALRRRAREAGVEVEGVTAERSRRAIDRGVGSDVELTRFGVARAATAERRRAIEMNQDNRNVINISAPGADAEEIRRRLESYLADRDERNRREANAAVSRTAP